MKKFLKQLRKDERGLTLVELLAVIVILGIIATIAFVSIGNVIENSKKDAHVANAQQLISAAKLAEASQGWPDGEGAGYTTGAESGNLKTLDTIEELTNPWDDTDEGYIGTVTKNDDNEYFVTIIGKAGTIELDITNAPENELTKGREGKLDNSAN